MYILLIFISVLSETSQLFYLSFQFKLLYYFDFHPEREVQQK